MNKHELNESDLIIALDLLSDLSDLLDSRVSELHKVQGMQAERHAFIYYREKVWSARRVLQNSNLIKNENE